MVCIIKPSLIILCVHLTILNYIFSYNFSLNSHTTIGAKKLYKLAKPDKDLTVLQLPADDDYKVTDRVYDKPENTESVIIDMHKNVAYDEVHLKR